MVSNVGNGGKNQQGTVSSDIYCNAVTFSVNTQPLDCAALVQTAVTTLLPKGVVSFWESLEDWMETPLWKRVQLEELFRINCSFEFRHRISTGPFQNHSRTVIKPQVNWGAPGHG